ncbi:MAG: hypothetical protein ACE5HE_07245 [Phycisphaerae bacterium]
MTTADMTRLSEAFEAVKSTAQEALRRGSADQFQQVESRLSRFGAEVRELQQSMWAEEARETVHRLEKGKELTPTDMQVIRTFVVSDAEQYLALENNYEDWLVELKRLFDEITKRVESVTRETIGELRGVLKDVERLVPDIRNHLEERSRVKKFDLATQTLDVPSRTLLARLLNDQLHDPKR